MSGIAGLVDFSRTASGAGRGGSDLASVARAMTGTMARRGPDGGVWLSEHAALGLRTLSPAGSDGPGLPTAFADGSGTRAVVAFSGELYNLRELAARLRSSGHTLRSDADAEVVLHAYLEWGPDFVTHIEGVYGFALWDEHRQELLLVRDRMGVKPLFHALTAAGVLFGSEPKAILAHPDFSAVLDADGLRDILSVARVPGHAIFRGMKEVLPGHTLRVTRTGTEERRYWGLEVRDHTDSLEQTVATLRELLESAVAQQMVADTTPCSLLSGGLDSSALTALAAQVARREGMGTLRSLSVNDEDPARPGGGGGNEDHVYARLMADHVGSDLSEISLGTLDLLDPALRASVLAAYDLPINKGDQYASLHQLFAEARRYATVALSGELGDDVFGGYNWQRLPEWVFSDTFPWIQEGRGRFRGNEVVFDPGLLAKLDLAAYERDSHSTAVAELSAAEAIADPTEARYREVTYLAQTRHARVLFDRLDRLGMACGLRIRVPFADFRLVDYAFNIPWAMKSFDGREKSLLRAAVRDLLPDPVAMRVKTPYPNLRTGAYDRKLRERLVAVVRDADSPVNALFSAEFRRTVAADGAAALEHGLSRAALETALQTDSWLRTYGVRIAL
ncbi:asparagine synthase (glutamine-hydrolyzing) [Streptomyces sp. NPDC098789]|uniref:asparagine synthase (glutamine-hydrolyzing) n=1 Tax=Streptomyces sp. NPDC098789 TaxID=3366098 RepID=UPI00382F6E5C